eukprot:1158873-Pelagomonas_calceolata.AAC.1
MNMQRETCCHPALSPPLQMRCALQVFAAHHFITSAQLAQVLRVLRYEQVRTSKSGFEGTTHWIWAFTA